MKNIYITIIVLILIVAGVFIFIGKDSKLEAPILTNNEIIPTTTDITTDITTNTITDTTATETTTINTTTNTTGEVKEFTVSGQNFSFTPNSLTVKKGDKVKITFQSVDGFHDFKIDEYGVATKQLKSPAEEVLEFTADKVGSFQYYCSVGTHRAMGMFGILKVE